MRNVNEKGNVKVLIGGKLFINYEECKSVAGANGLDEGDFVIH